MKIFHVYWSLKFGGIETMLINIANMQAQLGEQVSIVIINESYEDTLINSLDKNISLYILGRKVSSINIHFAIKLNNLLKEKQPDIIHLHNSNIALILNKHFFYRTCVTLHSIPQGVIKQSLFKQVWNKITGKASPYCNVTAINKIPNIFSISQTVKEQLKNHYNIESTVIYNGIDTKRFKQKTSTDRSTPLKIIMVSRLEHNFKGQDLLIEAISKIRGKATVDFIGSGSSLEFLKNLTHQLKCEQYIRFLGKKDQDYISSNLAGYDLFVQPSRLEGFGLTVAEAMAAQIPVLVSKGQGPAEVTCDNKYGWIFENGDVNDLAYQIEYIFNNYDIAIQKAQIGKEYVYKLFDIHSTANFYIEEYKKIIKRQVIQQAG